MGSGEYNNLKFYTKDMETGEMTEIPEISEFQDTEPHETPKTNMFSCDMSVVMDLTPAEVFRFLYGFFPRHINNWRKQHGMPVLRKKHIYNKRWYGK